MKLWTMVIDVARCEDCNNCLLACKDEHVENDWPGYSAPQPRHGHRWIQIARKERGQFPLIDVAYRPTTCMQCDKAPCVAASGGAVVKRSDGIVLIDPQKAKGRRDLVDSCPYGMIKWNEQEALPQKCTFCAHLLDDGWKQPRCAQACPTGALKAMLLTEAKVKRLSETQGLVQLHPEFGTSPRVLYAGMDKFDKCFIAGSVAHEVDGVVDCFKDVHVSLLQAGKKIADTNTDCFGNFRFDGLSENSTWYTVQIEPIGFEQRQLSLPQLTQSKNIGTLCFEEPRKS
jgi:Fe-S-cluster-containing dehydrogenase component